ncbi:hypothetical protein Cgig2_007067 [Carnegiea gigantea]|uniref:Uncharacterized protein n=1 Tax=Carnegiea gigantea TaxID=171969 RepID=A0A9Q1K9U6_9CARY|nr:hypothetical protein Cgig2_007067 [Carnegiea gigantea]
MQGPAERWGGKTQTKSDVNSDWLHCRGGDQRLTAWGISDCLDAEAPHVRREATMEAVELLLSRKIYNGMLARIYEEKPFTVATLTSTNWSNAETTDSLKFSYTKTVTQMWSSSVSETSIKAGIPLLADRKITVIAELKGCHKWGETKQISEQEVEAVHQVTVRPKKRITARLMATQGTCDVPFSYSLRDTLLDNTVIIHNSVDDGVFSSSTTYNFHAEIVEEPLK